jgi:RNA 3'-terminal phosphate cyclase
MLLVNNLINMKYYFFFLCFKGTSLYYVPGALTGGIVEHECSLQRSMGYFLELVLYMAPFMKTALELRLKGVTNDRDDPSVRLFFSYNYSLALWIYLG